MDLRDLERHLIARKRALGIVGNDFLPRNDDSRRTASKRHLLFAIEDAAAERGTAARFGAERGKLPDTSAPVSDYAETAD